MRVLHVINSLAASRGGPTYVLTHLAPALVELGVGVEILATRADLDPAGEREARRALDGIPLELVGVVGPARLELAPSLLPRLVARLRRADLVHVHTVFTFPVAAAQVACRALGVPYIVRPAGTLDAACIASRSERQKHLALAVYVRRGLNAAAAVQATSRKEAEELAALAPRAHVLTVENGIDLDVGAGVAPAAAGAGRRVAYLGRLHPKKRIEVLLRAMAQLPAEVEIELGGAGDAIYEQRLRSLAAELGIERRTHWRGHLELDGKRALLARADVVACPSLDENFGIVVAEAMAAGRPVVVSPEVALGDDVIASGAGRVVVAEPGRLAIALADLLADGAERQRQGARGRELARARWSWPAVASQTLNMYTEALRRARRDSR